MSTKTALSIGINYVGTEYELRGCINDADDWANLLSKYGFDCSVLAEKQATRAGILNNIKLLLSDLRPGDVAAITYSGHGTWVPDKDGDEPDGRDEAICPVNMGDDGQNLIIDDEFHAAFNSIPKHAHVFFVTDSCSSGTVYRFVNGFDSRRKVRFVPPAHFIKSIDKTYRMTLGYGQAAKKTNALLPGVIHLSGCKDNEYSNDAEMHGRPNGAMTYYAIKAIEKTIKHKGSYADAWKLLRESLPSWEFQQTPLLNALKALKDLPVLS